MSTDVREVALTRGYVALVDADDFQSVSKRKWHAHVGSKRRGGPGSVYAYRREFLEFGEFARLNELGVSNG
jgi:hypothetical protein